MEYSGIDADGEVYSACVEEGRDDASGYSYRLSATVTETADSALLPKNGLQVIFRYNFLANNDPPTARYTIDLSGEISGRSRRGIWMLLACYGVPLAARNHTVGLLYQLYKYPIWPTGREPIKASFVVNAYNYVSDPHQDGFGDEVFLYLGEDPELVSPRVMVMTEAAEGAEEEEEEDYCLRPTPASREAVEALEKVRVSGETSCCAVCFEGFGFGSEATRMPCSHVFHGDCIVRWLENRCVCPLCRFPLPSAV